MNAIKETIDYDLQTLENEAMGVEALSEGALTDLMEICGELEQRVKRDYKLECKKCVRLDTDRVTGAMAALVEKPRFYLSRLSTVRAKLRRLRASEGGLSSPIVAGVTETVPRINPSSGGYKPFMKKLEPPTFSGHAEDWPEFRSVWQDLLADIPESVQVQHLKSSIRETDAKRVTGVKSVAEIWHRLEKVYGDKDLNIITVKTI